MLGMTQVRVEPVERSPDHDQAIVASSSPSSRSATCCPGRSPLRDVPHWSVFWVNLLLGWTIVGWIIALVMSLRSQRQVIVASQSTSPRPVARRCVSVAGVQ